MSDPAADHVVAQFRDGITDADLAILDAVNKRIALVQQLHAYKVQKGYDLSDPAREDWLRSYLLRCNRGPLSPEELEELVQTVLDLTRREVTRLRAAAEQTAPTP